MKICHSKGGKGGGMKKARVARVARVVPKAAYAYGAKTLTISKIFAPSARKSEMLLHFFVPLAQNASFVEFVVPQLPSLFFR